MAGVGLRVRLATLDEARGITEVHCSDVEQWVRAASGRGEPAEYEELSVEDRYLHGGPWMSVETCAVHLNYVLTSGQYALVAELDGRVVGELELYVGEERGVLGRTAYIDVLVVHKDFRRRGVGRALVSEARRLAVEEGCDTLSVWPEADAIPFYEKCGVRSVAYRVAHFVVAPDKATEGATAEVEPLPHEYSCVRGSWLISPRTWSSAAAWLKCRWPLALRVAKSTVDEGRIPSLSATFILGAVERDGLDCWLTLWLDDPGLLPSALSAICERARAAGCRRLHVLVDEQLASKVTSLRASLVQRELVLFERLG
ncbi:MAG: GNAT family N-acetyltransferase [Thermoprotei archaeon]|nr:MAG: GNAT family N-acetyltransferase [Thermoprotei archaeon]